MVNHLWNNQLLTSKILIFGCHANIFSFFGEHLNHQLDHQHRYSEILGREFMASVYLITSKPKSENNKRNGIEFSNENFEYIKFLIENSDFIINFDNFIKENNIETFGKKMLNVSTKSDYENLMDVMFVLLNSYTKITNPNKLREYRIKFKNKYIEIPQTEDFYNKYYSYNIYTYFRMYYSRPINMPCPKDFEKIYKKTKKFFGLMPPKVNEHILYWDNYINRKE